MKILIFFEKFIEYLAHVFFTIYLFIILAIMIDQRKHVEKEPRKIKF